MDQIRFVSPFSSIIVVCGHCLVCDFVTHNQETLGDDHGRLHAHAHRPPAGPAVQHHALQTEPEALPVRPTAGAATPGVVQGSGRPTAGAATPGVVQGSGESGVHQTTCVAEDVSDDRVVGDAVLG